jgi:hypothetical protein
MCFNHDDENDDHKVKVARMVSHEDYNVAFLERTPRLSNQPVDNTIPSNSIVIYDLLPESDIVIDGMETFVLNFKREIVLDFILDPRRAREAVQRRLKSKDHSRQRKDCVASLVNHLKLTGEIPRTHEDMKIFNRLLMLLDAKLHESVQSLFL